MALPIIALPALEYLNECFDYALSTGQLRWKTRPPSHFTALKEWKRWNARFAGTLAGHKQRHSRITLGGHTYAAHRVVWKLVTGKEPPANIDHINRDGCDNLWSNLREADQAKQNWNKGRQKNNRSGYRGVTQDRKSWRALISVKKVQHHLGSFPTAEDAAKAYADAARAIHGEFYTDSGTSWRCRK